MTAFALYAILTINILVASRGNAAALSNAGEHDPAEVGSTETDSAKFEHKDINLADNDPAADDDKDEKIVRITDIKKLEGIMEAFTAEYNEYVDKYKHENEGNKDENSDYNRTVAFSVNPHKHRRHKRTAPNFICNLPAPQNIWEITPEFRIYRSHHNTMTIHWYMPEHDFVNHINHMLQGAERVVFVTHGFTAGIESSWLYDIKDRIFRHDRRDNLVILVGWAAGAAPGWNPSKIYRQAAANTETIGRYIGSIAHAIKTRQQNMHVYGVGHSLGSHVMGWAGRESILFSNQFNRITALDPAGPCWETNNIDKRLRISDADLVDVIHTDGYQRFIPPQMHFGTLLRLGHIDFYPNWGRRMQPGCGRTMVACSHSRAIDLYIWSIAHPGPFVTNQIVHGAITWDKITDVPGFTQDQDAEMGYYADTKYLARQGQFYLVTNNEEPWVTKHREYFLIRHGPSGKVLDACNDHTGFCEVGVETILVPQHDFVDNQQWFQDGQLIRNKMWPDKVLDFHYNDYKAKGYGRVYLNSDDHGQDNQRWAFHWNGIENLYREANFRLDLYNNDHKTGGHVGCYPTNGEGSQNWFRTVGHAYFILNLFESDNLHLTANDDYSVTANSYIDDLGFVGFGPGSRQQWYHEGGYLRNAMFPDRVLDFHYNDYYHSIIARIGRPQGWGKVYLQHPHGKSNQKWSFVGNHAVQSHWENRGLRLDVLGNMWYGRNNGRVFDSGNEVGCYNPNNTPAQNIMRIKYLYALWPADKNK